MADKTQRLVLPSRKVTRGVGAAPKVQTEPFKVQTPTPARKVQKGVGNSGSNVRLEPLDHLIQHIKQYDPRLYEALKRLGDQLTQNVDDIVQQFNQTPDTTVTQQDKVTFGLVKTLVVADALTLYYICRKAGSWIDFTAKIKDQVPNGTDAILDIKRSADDGTTWTSIFPVGNLNKIVLPKGKSKLVTIKKFAIKDINIGDLLRIDCLQAGSTDAGKGIEVVGRWASSSPANP